MENRIKKLSLIIPIIPKGQKRARSGKGFMYKDREQANYEASMRVIMSRHAPDTPHDGAVKVTFTAVLPIPRSRPTWFIVAALEGRIAPTVKPDIDNIEKNLLECMTMFGYVNDDKQVVSVDKNKIYGEKGQWLIEIEMYPAINKKSDLYDDMPVLVEPLCVEV